ncbi:MAG: hypothetical protein EOO42_18960, partial [Flavobacteriales bacterium]
MNNQQALQNYDSDFFVLRTPLTSIKDLLELHQTLTAEGYEAFAKKLLQLFKEPLLQDALYLASPVLRNELLKIQETYSVAPIKLIDSLYQYYIRMATRCTPFGLFAGTSIGKLSEARTELRLHSAKNISKYLRLDMNYLCLLANELGTAKPLSTFSYHANSSCYKIGNKIRYTETRFFGDNRSYHITHIDNNQLLELLLPFTATNKTYAQIITFIEELGIPQTHAIQYTDDLIKCQMLVNNLEANVTGVDYMDYLVKELDQTDTNAEHLLLEKVVNAIKRDQTKGIKLFSEVKAILSELPAAIDETKLFQMDIAKKVISANLSNELLQRVKACTNVLSKLTYDISAFGNLAKFKMAFEERYETRTVKLTEALDAEIGIDYQNIISNAHLGQPDYNPGTNPILGYKLGKLQHALKNGLPEVEIMDHELGFIKQSIKLPTSIGAMIKLHKTALEQEPQLEFKFAGGPSAANILGRFCQSNPEMNAKIQEQLRIEENEHSEKIFAEIVHLPQARVGNVLARPHLRKYEIVFLAQSTLPNEYVITLNELYLKLEYGRLVLFSKRLKKEIVPRLS